MAIKVIKGDKHKLQLYKNNNGQDVKSDETIRKIRQEALKMQDCDTDDVRDIERMQEQEQDDFDAGNKYAKNIQNINSRPFSVCAFNRRQFEALVNEKAKKGELTGHVDATGGVAWKPKNVKKRMLYYDFAISVTPAEGEDEKNCRILPFSQMLGCVHDQFYIGVWLKLFKRRFCEIYPNEWPIIIYAVTDFSLAIINAIMEDWNRLSLKEYLQIVYDNITTLNK